MAATSPETQTPQPAESQRWLGAFQLLELLGKSSRTMAWRVRDRRDGQDRLLVMPRTRPADAAALRLWLQGARSGARIDHPSLARAVEIGEAERWPYIAYAAAACEPLSARIGRAGQPALEMAPWAVQVLEGLAFAHEAGVAHHDLQAWMVLLEPGAPARLLGLGAAPQVQPTIQQGLPAQRRAAELDLVALGLVMHHALTGRAALDRPDVNLAIERMAPLGREVVRLPWSAGQPIPEPLRAIVNRATERQERQRYHNARTLLRALEGWLRAEGEQGAGPLAQVLDRLRTVGLLPAMPGSAQRAARMALMDRERNDELADVVLQDTALTFEMIRLVNSAQVRGAMAVGSGPILTVRRAIDMLGLDGVRRAALSLRDWPGPLGARHAGELERLIERVRRAGRIAQWLRPAGYDGELVFLLAMLQNLGRLVVRYHFPEEAAQIDRLMQPMPAAREGDPDEPGMTEEAAYFAVIGVDAGSIAAAIGHLWGLDASVLFMIQRLPPGAPVRVHGSDSELLRMTASCANEVIEAVAGPAKSHLSALQRVAQRYGRALGVTVRDLQAVAQGQPAVGGNSLDAPVTQIGSFE